MTSLQSKLQEIANALVTALGENVFHYWRTQIDPPYCIWQEDGEEASLEADNHKQGQAIGGSVDYFTKLEYDPAVDDIQEALNGIENVSWVFDMAQREEETNLVHFSWSFRIIL